MGTASSGASQPTTVAEYHLNADVGPFSSALQYHSFRIVQEAKTCLMQSRYEKGASSNLDLIRIALL